MITGIRHIILEEAILPCLYAVRMCHCFPTFRRNLPPSSSRSRTNHGVITVNLKAVVFFETSGNSLTHGATTCFLDTQTDLQLIKSFNAVSLQWVKRQPCRYTSRIFPYCILSLSLVSQKTGRLAVIIVALLTFKWTTCRKLHTAFSLSLSRTHTRTHARTLQAAKLAANTLLP